MNVKDRKVLVTGGTGMIGQPLVELLLKKGAKVTIASLDSPDRLKNADIEFVKTDLRDYNNCLEVIQGKEIVFHLAGVKGSPSMTRDMPASFFVPMLQF